MEPADAAAAGAAQLKSWCVAYARAYGCEMAGNGAHGGCLSQVRVCGRRARVVLGAQVVACEALAQTPARGQVHAVENRSTRGFAFIAQGSHGTSLALFKATAPSWWRLFRSGGEPWHAVALHPGCEFEASICDAAEWAQGFRHTLRCSQLVLGFSTRSELLLWADLIEGLGSQVRRLHAANPGLVGAATTAARASRHGSMSVSGATGTGSSSRNDSSDSRISSTGTDTTRIGDHGTSRSAGTSAVGAARGLAPESGPGTAEALPPRGGWVAALAAFLLAGAKWYLLVLALALVILLSPGPSPPDQSAFSLMEPWHWSVFAGLLYALLSAASCWRDRSADPEARRSVTERAARIPEDALRAAAWAVVLSTAWHHGAVYHTALLRGALPLLAAQPISQWRPGRLAAALVVFAKSVSLCLVVDALAAWREPARLVVTAWAANALFTASRNLLCLRVANAAPPVRCLALLTLLGPPVLAAAGLQVPVATLPSAWSCLAGLALARVAREVSRDPTWIARLSPRCVEAASKAAGKAAGAAASAVRMVNKRPRRVDGCKLGECAVCLQDLRGCDACSELDCGHVFHSHCAVSWLKVRRTCPLCRTPSWTHAVVNVY